MFALRAEQHLDRILPPRLPRLLAHPRVLALGAALGHGLIPGEPVALGVVGAAVEKLAEAALAGGDVALALGAGEAFEDFLFDGFALGVVDAADELAVAAVAFDEALAAGGAVLARGLIRGHGDALGVGLHDAFAGGVVGAGPEGAELALAELHGLGAAEGALRRVFGLLHLLQLLGAIAVGVAGAAQEEAVAADALEHGA